MRASDTETFPFSFYLIDYIIAYSRIFCPILREKSSEVRQAKILLTNPSPDNIIILYSGAKDGLFKAAFGGIDLKMKRRIYNVLSQLREPASGRYEILQ